MEDKTKNMKNQTLEDARKGRISPLEAVERLDQEIGGITAAIWNPGAGQYKILNHAKMVQLPMRNTTRKEQDRLQELAALSYWKAQQNGSLKPGELHFEKGYSTKDYKKGFNNYLTSLLQSYQN